MDLKPYPKYKDSGIEWMGEIPEGWEIRKLKYVANIEMGQSPDSDFYNKEGNGVPFLQGNADFKEIYPQPQVWTTEGNKYSKKDDILVSVRAPVGEINISDNRYAIGRGLVAIGYNEKSDFKYYYYLFTVAKNYFDSVATGTTYSAISTDDVKNIVVAVPLIEKQIQISNYLDHRTNRIDELIKKDEKLIELLKEKRQAIISHAVTKGLDPNAKMKDSGIEWIGEIPEGWKMVPMKYVTYMKGRIGWQGLKQSEFTEEGPYLITGMNFKDGIIRWEEVYHITEERYNEAPEIHLKIWDVLMTKDGTIGKLLFVDVLPGKASLNSHLLVLRPLKDHFLPKYLYYLLNSEYFKDHIETYKTGTTFFGITQEAVGFFEMLLPPIEEQQAVIEFIDLENTKIDQAISKILKQIDLLKEYRQTLISNVVTGKVKVC